MNNPEEGLELGKILKAHGIKGEVLVQFEVERPEDFTDLESVFVEINQKLIPFFIEAVSDPKSGKAIVKFEDIDSTAEASALSGKKIYIPLNSLPELEEGDYYLHEIIDFTVVDKSLGQLGKVEEIYELPGQYVLGMRYKEKEVLIPVNKALLLSADKKNKLLQVDLPTGLVELYMDEEKHKKEEDED